MGENRIQGGRVPTPPGLPRAERPTGFMYLARRRSDGTHWLVLAMNWIRQEVQVIDYKDPQAEPIIEPFANLDIMDKREIDGAGPEIIIPGRNS